jgi:hypothetical protein
VLLPGEAERDPDRRIIAMLNGRGRSVAERKVTQESEKKKAPESGDLEA